VQGELLDWLALQEWLIAAAVGPQGLGLQDLDLKVQALVGLNLKILQKIPHLMNLNLCHLTNLDLAHQCRSWLLTQNSYP
jgi:hypothetical protein